MQIVLAHPGESNGAVVAPLLSTDGCIGALSAEIRGGGESSESVQALAAIFAAQLAGVLNTSSGVRPRTAQHRDGDHLGGSGGSGQARWVGSVR